MQYLSNRSKIHVTQQHKAVVYSGERSEVKPQIAYMFTAGNAIQDAYTTKWSYIDVFSVISIPASLDYTIQNFVVAGKINNASAGPSSTTIRIVDPVGNAIAKVELSGVLTKGDVVFSAFFGLVKLQKAGRYHLKILLDGKALVDGSKFYFDVMKEQ